MKEHFKGEELFVSRINDWKSRALNFEMVLTPFLTPREISVLQSLIGKNQLKITLFSQIVNGEKKRAIISLKEITPNKDDFKISLLKGTYKNYWFNIGHRDVLGVIMASGLKFSAIGDIAIFKDLFYVELFSNMVKQLKLEINKIGKAKVHYIVSDKFINKVENIQKLFIHTKSFRIDNIISQVYNLSRSKSKELILSNKVSYNYKVDSNFSQEVEVDSTIMVKGYGKFDVGLIKIKANGRYLLKIHKHL